MKQSILLNQIEKEKVKSLSLIGMAKNVGKTETLNHLIQAGWEQGMVFGVTSAGLDGEGKDLITLGKKPVIWLPQGFLFATAEACLLKANLRYELLEDSGFHNALGQVYIARVKEPGLIELAGPPMKSGLKAIREILEDLGAHITIIDGALDRIGAASSYITEGTILCTGSVVGKSLEQIGAKTGAKFEQLTLPGVPKDLLDIKNINDNFFNSKIILLDGDLNRTPVFMETLVGNENKILSLLKKEGQVRYLVINGAVSQKLLELVIFNASYFKDIHLIIRSGNALFTDEKTWDRYKKAHGKIYVMEPIKVLGVSVNPYSPFGRSFTPKELIATISTRIKQVKLVPVVDVLSGYGL